MSWNWQHPDWPNFSYDRARVSHLEREFLQNAGGADAILRASEPKERKLFTVEVLCTEALKSSEIEGEILERKSLRSSIRRHFGLATDGPFGAKEQGVAELMHHVYETFDQPLTHQMLYDWHSMLMVEASGIEHIGKYRSHAEPMQIVSGRYDTPRVYFEAPPSHIVEQEMTSFIESFNTPDQQEPLLGRAARVHVYFESIHPFEDGNGRIGRALVEKVLSQGLSRPVLIATSQEIERKKKAYYEALGQCNRTLKIDGWIEYFATVLSEAQKNSRQQLNFLLQKHKLLNSLTGTINVRQEKALVRMYDAGVNGFQGGLSAENYISITKTSRATASRDLADLVEKGALRKTGKLRHTRYWLQHV